MASPLTSTLKRIGRSLIACGITGALMALEKDPKFIFLLPVIQGLGKFLRAAFGAKYIPF